MSRLITNLDGFLVIGICVICFNLITNPIS